LARSILDPFSKLRAELAGDQSFLLCHPFIFSSSFEEAVPVFEPPRALLIGCLYSFQHLALIFRGRVRLFPLFSPNFSGEAGTPQRFPCNR